MKRNEGFSLIELMISAAIILMVMVYVMQAFTVQHKAYVVIDQVAEAQQNLRAISDLIEHDVRRSGYMVPIHMALCGWDETGAPDTLFTSKADAIRSINQLCVGEWESFARHPSPLYQAFAEGLVLFAVVWLVASRPRTLGVVSGIFLGTYGALRFCTEYFRQPDSHLGFIAFDWLTMGQLLSLPMLIVGILILCVALRSRNPVSLERA